MYLQIYAGTSSKYVNLHYYIAIADSKTGTIKDNEDRQVYFNDLLKKEFTIGTQELPLENNGVSQREIIGMLMNLHKKINVELKQSVKQNENMKKSNPKLKTENTIKGVTLNEIRRMQQLAGIEPINELSAGLRNRAAIKARDRGGKDSMVGQSKSESIFEIPKKYQDIAYKIAESISTYFTDLVFTSPKGIKDCKVNIVNPYLIKDATASKDVYIDLSFYSTDVYNNTAEKKYKLRETFALYRMYMRKKFFGLSSKIEESTSDSFSEYIAKCKLNGTDKMPSNSNGESVSGIDSEIKSLLNKLKSELGAKINEGKFKKDDLVYNTKTKTVGIVRIGDDKYGEVKTDADGNVDVDDLEKYNPIKNKHQKDAKASPSTKKEVNSRGLFNPFKNE